VDERGATHTLAAGDDDSESGAELAPAPNRMRVACGRLHHQAQSVVCAHVNVPLMRRADHSWYHCEFTRHIRR
jgi:hypothetical protein